LGSFGALIIVALVAVVLYYAYKGVKGGDEETTCQGIHTSCLQTCRRTRTEAAELQRCQEGCQRDVDACERKSPALPE
jgi:hypothetical protein